MKFSKKILCKRKKKNKKKQQREECWYNNSQEILDKGMGEIPTDTSALVPSGMYMQSSKQLSH